MIYIDSLIYFHNNPRKSIPAEGGQHSEIWHCHDYNYWVNS